MSEQKKRTVSEAGWHQSRYNVIAKIPGTDKIGISNTYSASFALYSPEEVYLLSEAETLDEDHPIVELFKKRGLIVDFDERDALMTMGKFDYVGDSPVTFTLSVTQACNFDCAYCFEYHRGHRMSPENQDKVVELADRLLEVSGRKGLHIIWFGGEPLLAPDIIDSMSQKFMEITKKRGVKYSASIITNGYLLTQDIVDMLYRNKVESAVIGLDGVGQVHDDARHLVNGGPTFEKITDNLRTLKIPFKVSIRQIVHVHNREQLDELGQFIEKLVAESGNEIIHSPDIAYDFVVPEERDFKINMVEAKIASDVGILRDTARFLKARGHHCGGHSLWDVVIHSSGALQKCWPAIDHPELAFGKVGEWDPADPYNTASHPENLKNYCATTIPKNGDKECQECKWLPFCVGGCPFLRIFYQKECVQYKNYSEDYIMGLYNKLLKKENQA